ncbi:MAG: pilin, partial [Patescibacteria group bacterium]|nr:pilin [Patescibacteria group bacterium]
MPKKFIKILSLIIFAQIFCCAVFLIPISVDAIDPYKFQIPIGDLDKITFEEEGTTKPIADYIQAIYKYAIGVVAILATVVMMIGGVVWITAGGNQGRVGEAKQYISGALTGMVLVFCSYMILNTINPDLVKLKTVGIKSISKNTKSGCCTYESVISTSPLKTKITCRHISEKTCTSNSGSYTANAKCSTSVTPPVCIEITSDDDTGIKGCCSYTFSEQIRCRNNYTEEKCEEKYEAASPYWDEEDCNPDDCDE